MGLRLLGHHPEFKNIKNASLASSPKWQEVWRMIKQKVHDSMNHEDDAGSDVFSSQKSEKSEEETVLDPRAIKRQLQKLPSTMTLNLMEVDCTFRTPSNLKQSELVIQLDSRQLVDSLLWLSHGGHWGCVEAQAEKTLPWQEEEGTY